jgi:two-component system, cell cycle sensor histidine kinase and response regulator CckA
MAWWNHEGVEARSAASHRRHSHIILSGPRPGSVVSEKQSAGSNRSAETILVVEDDEPIRNAVRRILEAAGYRVLPAATPMEAIELASSRRVPIHVLLTDVGLLGVTGPQLAKLIVADRPGLRVLYISGHSEAHAVPAGRVGPGTAFLQKPFTMESLLREVRGLLDQGVPREEAGGQ